MTNNTIATFYRNVYETKIPTTNFKQSILAIGNVQSGKTRFMINETKKALQGDYDVVVLLGGTNNMLLDQSYKRFNKDLRDTGFPVFEINSLPARGVRGSKKIITSLKGKTALIKLAAIIGETVDKKIMIFDDESDFASINTAKNGFTPVHLLIKELFEGMEMGTFVSVTATPFADLLSDDGFNFDGVIRLKPGDGYKGLKDFNESDVYKTIDVTDFRAGGDIKSWIEVLLKHIETIASLGLNASQLLINTSLAKKEHTKIAERVHRILTIMRSQRVSLLFRDKTPDALKIRSKIIDELLENIFTLNQENGEWNPKANAIIIGGSLVSRGYTFERLITTLMFNVPNGLIQADTLLQRARWFGYRENFTDMSVYMSSKLKLAYVEMEELNNIIFDDGNDLTLMKKKINELNLGIVSPSGKI